MPAVAEDNNKTDEVRGLCISDHTNAMPPPWAEIAKIARERRGIKAGADYSENCDSFVFLTITFDQEGNISGLDTNTSEAWRPERNMLRIMNLPKTSLIERVTTETIMQNAKDVLRIIDPDIAKYKFGIAEFMTLWTIKTLKSDGLIFFKADWQSIAESRIVIMSFSGLTGQLESVESRMAPEEEMKSLWNSPNSRNSLIRFSD